MQGLRVAASGAPNINVVFMFEYDMDEPSPQFIRSKDKHKDLLTILVHRPEQL
jgi:hypothetical protein